MRKTKSGFTLVELLVVIAIIGILTAIGFVSYSSIQSNTRDQERSSRLTILAEALEKYYDQNGEYPGCNAMLASANTIVSTTLPGVDPNVLADPSVANGTNSISSCTNLINTGPEIYAYVGDGSTNCLNGQSCPQFTLEYLAESTRSVISINSRRSASNP